ncbi:hypothetical protein PAPYR_3449 [Paratrimastix pyriformis]|uniref:Protein kinase domain-containing protein n=1 Tax=Paratrimastix pyriformis TaxID=342808 RepID=A0ABQ8UPN4_9EUKA|nr:hypothetical protein PAPYR_3449 [Paratrimastix pyriformis]
MDSDFLNLCVPQQPTGKFAVLLYNGSFNPVHQGHVRTVTAAKKALSSRGWDVLGGFLTCTHDSGCQRKSPAHFCSAIHRNRMLALAARGVSWLAVDEFQSAQAHNPGAVRSRGHLVQHLQLWSEAHHLESPIILFSVCGADALHLMEHSIEKDKSQYFVTIVDRAPPADLPTLLARPVMASAIAEGRLIVEHNPEAVALGERDGFCSSTAVRDAIALLASTEPPPTGAADQIEARGKTRRYLDMALEPAVLQYLLDERLYLSPAESPVPPPPHKDKEPRPPKPKEPRAQIRDKTPQEPRLDRPPAASPMACAATTAFVADLDEPIPARHAPASPACRLVGPEEGPERIDDLMPADCLHIRLDGTSPLAPADFRALFPSRLGRGVCGVIFQTALLGRPVAAKLFPLDYRVKYYSQLFKREHGVMRALGVHPNIIRCYGWGLLETGGGPRLQEDRAEHVSPCSLTQDELAAARTSCSPTPRPRALAAPQVERRDAAIFLERAACTMQALIQLDALRAAEELGLPAHWTGDEGTDAAPAMVPFDQPASQRAFPSPFWAQLCLDVARGCAHMAAQGVYHRDLTLKNILLVTPPGVHSGALTAPTMLAEGATLFPGCYGLATLPAVLGALECDAVRRSEQQGETPSVADSGRRLTAVCAKVCDFGVATVARWCRAGPRGSLRHYPREALDQSKADGFHYCSACDVHSFGCLLFELASGGRTLWADLDTGTAIMRMKSGQRPPLPPVRAPWLVHPRYLDLVRACWVQDSQARPTFAQCVIKLEELCREVQQ